MSNNLTDSMIDRITDDRNPHELTDAQQAEMDERDEAIERTFQENRKDEDLINDAIIDDGYELSNDIAEIIANLNAEAESADQNATNMMRAIAMASIQKKVNDSLLRMAQEEHAED